MSDIITLASSSPRRAEILSRCGVIFTVCSPRGEERFDKSLPPDEAAKLTALKKAEEAVLCAQTPIIIAADTIVVTDSGRVLGKPRDRGEAHEMLTELSGRRHTVITAVALADCRGKNIVYDVFSESTDVFMKPLTPGEINAYSNTGEPMDKAGAYGIQGKGALFIERIDGDFYNVMGLPVHALYKKLCGLGLTCGKMWK